MDHSRLLRVAFGDCPDATMRVQSHAPAAERWLAAVALGAAGRYGTAAALLDQLVRDPHPGNQVVRAHAAVTRAAHLRQVGGHRAARRWDGLGLAFASVPGGTQPGDAPGGAQPGDPPAGPLAEPPARLVAEPGLDRAAARADALLGLAADAIGLGELGLADRLVRAAQPVALGHPSWRPGVRWYWVSAELALCRDRPEQAADLAGVALRAAERAGATRHQVKSELVLAVARTASGADRDQMINLLAGLSERARLCGLTTLDWPIQLQLATLLAAIDPERANAHRRAVSRTVARIRQLADPFARSVLDHSPWVPSLTEP